MRWVAGKAPILALLATILAPVAFAQQLTNDDIEFRKKVYTN